jgi:Ca2+-binding EF-hand superfamily protein
VLTARSPRSVEAVTSNKKVISFLVNCGNKNLQYLLVPVRLEAALTAMDTDRDGHIDVDEWETCIEDALKNKLAARAAKRELDAKNAAKEIEEFTNEFLSAARRCFELIDKDGGGTLSTAEIVEAVKSDAEVIDFLKNCGEENLQFLLHPPRLKKALAVLDEDKSGEIDVEECAARRLTYIRTPRVELSEAPASLVDVRTGETAIQKGLAHRLEQLSIERQRRDRANARADEEFSAEFLSAARAVFLMIDKDESGFLDKEEMSARCVRPSTCARRGDGARSAAAYTPSTRLVAHRPIPAQRHRRQSRQRSDRLPHELRQQEPPVPAGPLAPRGGPRAAGLGPRRRD